MKKTPYLLALLPILFLIGLLSINVYLYGDDSLGGSNQLSLLFSGALAAIIGILYDDIFGVIAGIGSAVAAIGDGGVAGLVTVMIVAMLKK